MLDETVPSSEDAGIWRKDKWPELTVGTSVSRDHRSCFFELTFPPLLNLP